MQPEENKWLVVRQPLQPPAIDPHLEELNAVVRSTECLRHLVLSLEFWISPKGRLRWWLRINICLAAWIFIPAIFVMPIVSVILREVDASLSVVLSIALKIVLLTALVSVVVLATKHFPSSSPGSSRRRK